MDKKTQKTSKDILSPGKTSILLNNVIFSKTWAFWENYTSKTSKLSYSESNKKIFKWNDIITFFQFWNKYPGNDIKNIFFDGNNLKYFFEEKYRINSMNIFLDGVEPMWEDEKNKGGKYYQLDYRVPKEKIDEFIEKSNYQWKKLALSLMGNDLPGAEFINGIRFIDKTDFERGKIIMFRIEVWVGKNVNEKIIEDIKNYLKENLGCEKINIFDIK
jgi:hypothetical protein